MRHQKSKYQLNRFTSWRSATLTSLARSIILHQSIKTTKLKQGSPAPFGQFDFSVKGKHAQRPKNGFPNPKGSLPGFTAL